MHGITSEIQAKRAARKLRGKIDRGPCSRGSKRCSTDEAPSAPMRGSQDMPRGVPGASLKRTMRKAPLRKSMKNLRRRLRSRYYTSSSIKSLSIPPPPPLTPRVVSRQPFLRPGRRGTRQPPHTPWKFNEVGQEFVEIVREQSASRQAETGYQMWMRAWARLKDMQTKLGFDEETRAKLEVLIFFALKDFDSFLAYPEERWESCVKAHLRLAAREDSRWKN